MPSRKQQVSVLGLTSCSPLSAWGYFSRIRHWSLVISPRRSSESPFPWRAVSFESMLAVVMWMKAIYAEGGGRGWHRGDTSVKVAPEIRRVCWRYQHCSPWPFHSGITIVTEARAVHYAQNPRSPPRFPLDYGPSPLPLRLHLQHQHNKDPPLTISA